LNRDFGRVNGKPRLHKHPARKEVPPEMPFLSVGGFKSRLVQNSPCEQVSDFARSGGLSADQTLPAA
jgi:hypothetical protein